MGKGGLNGVHQVRHEWQTGRSWTVEEAEYADARCTSKLVKDEQWVRSEMVKAFHANKPDIRKIKTLEARNAAINTFLSSKRWQRIVAKIRSKSKTS